MLGLDRDRLVFAAELDQHEPAFGFQRLPEPLKSDIGVGALVIDVNHQNEIDLCLGELGVELGGADRLDVRDPGLARVVALAS